MNYELNKRFSAKTLMAFIALLAAIGLAFLSYCTADDLTTNVLLTIAQFLMYSLTMMGFGEIVKFIMDKIRK